VQAARWYLRYDLSYRDVEELLSERGIEVDHVTVYRWDQRFTPLLADAAGPCRHAVGDRWYVDETFVKVAARGGMCTERSISSVRTSTCSSRPAAICEQHEGSSRPRYARMVSRSRS